MKVSTFLFITILSCIGSDSFAQNKWVNYKSNNWFDYKNKGFVDAQEHPTNENAEITITDKSIKVVLGKKVLNYEKISMNEFSDVRLDYVVSLNGKKTKISKSTMHDRNGNTFYYISEIDEKPHSYDADGPWGIITTNVSYPDN
jgi:hypothetical protein